MSGLTEKEQRHVRVALRFLRVRSGGAWAPVAKALHVEEDTISKIAHERRPVTERLAVRVARFVNVSIDELLAGTWLSARVCRHCGHPPDDFEDEETVVESDEGPALTVLDGGKS